MPAQFLLHHAIHDAWKIRRVAQVVRAEDHRVAGVVRKHGQRRPVRAVDAQHRHGGVDRRGGDARLVDFEPAHCAVGIHAQAVVSNVDCACSYPEARRLQPADRLRDGAPDLLQRGLLPCGRRAAVFVADHWRAMRVRRSYQQTRDPARPFGRLPQMGQRSRSKAAAQVQGHQRQPAGRALRACLQHQHARV
jgi:hypothetical protein